MFYYVELEVARTMTGPCGTNGQVEFRVKCLILHGPIRCWRLLWIDVEQFLSHVVCDHVGTWEHDGVVSGRVNRMQCGEAAVQYHGLLNRLSPQFSREPATC